MVYALYFGCYPRVIRYVQGNLSKLELTYKVGGSQSWSLILGNLEHKFNPVAGRFGL